VNGGATKWIDFRKRLEFAGSEDGEEPGTTTMLKQGSVDLSKAPMSGSLQTGAFSSVRSPRADADIHEEARGY